MSQITFDRFRQMAEAEGLKARDCGNGHWQIIGPLVVNYYPDAKGGPTIYVRGTHRSTTKGGPKKAIQAAKIPPPKTKLTERDQSLNRLHKRRMLKKDPRCYWCKKKLDRRAATVDHVVPLGRGGSNNPNNLVLSCLGCNQGRGSDMPEVASES